VTGAKLNLVSELLQGVNGVPGGVSHDGRNLHAPPPFAARSQRITPPRLMVDTKLTHQHVQHILEAGAEPATTDREVKIRHPRHACPLGHPAGELLATRRPTTGSRHHERQGIPVSMDLHVSPGDIASCHPHVLIPEERFTGGLGPGVDLDSGFLDSQKLPGTVPNAVVLRREVQQRSTINGERDPSARLLVNADAIDAWTMKRSSTERFDVLPDYRLHGRGEVGGKAFRFSYQSVAGGHSDRR
jgi:hypothetical protein